MNPCAKAHGRHPACWGTCQKINLYNMMDASYFCKHEIMHVYNVSRTQFSDGWREVLGLHDSGGKDRLLVLRKARSSTGGQEEVKTWSESAHHSSDVISMVELHIKYGKAYGSVEISEALRSFLSRNCGKETARCLGIEQ
jgi:hypothetical protein